MKTSDAGLKLLMEREGKMNRVYRDSVGVLTVGYGHTGPDVREGDVWTDNQIEEAFKKDLARFEQAINSGVGQGIALSQNQFDALVSFSYNVGVAGFLGSTVLKRIKARDYGGAAVALDMWHIPPEITSRRNGEREQFRGSQFKARL